MEFPGFVNETIIDTTVDDFWADWAEANGGCRREDEGEREPAAAMAERDGQPDSAAELDGEPAMDDVPELDGAIKQNESDDGSIQAPDVGMQFDSKEAVYDFYKAYGKRLGFPVRTRSTTKHKNGVDMVGVLLECSHAGSRSTRSKNQLKPQPSMQMGCGAKIRARTNYEGLWEISKICLEHNHPMSPTKARLFRCYRTLTPQAMRQVAINDVAGIRLHKTFNAAVVEAGGYDQLPFIEKDCRNYIEKVRQLRLGSGDAMALQEFFSKMQAQSPGFFYVLDLDDESRLRNVFWADSRCRYAYKDFGDVITFDTTYLTNRYDMPFAPFVGVNHHGQSSLLGCGLISNEDTQTFVWLFTAWLECMEGRAPMGIITDQDRAMQNAIQIVFPNTRHRWCLWHIMKKVPEKMGGITEKKEILDAIHESIYDSQYIPQFEQSWNDMIQRYSLQDHEWLVVMYNERHR
ncbi:unnamed protein product, partial [Cuscuta epithymum]